MHKPHALQMETQRCQLEEALLTLQLNRMTRPPTRTCPSDSPLCEVDSAMQARQQAGTAGG